MKNIIYKSILIIGMAWVSLPLFADDTLWLDEVKKKSCCTAGSKALEVKAFTVKKGTLEESETEHNLKNAIVYIRDMDNNIIKHNVIDGKISFSPLYKGNYHLFLEQKSVRDEVLYVHLSSLRVYNKEGDISKSVLKEMRGKTNDSQYGREPLDQISFEIIMERPIRKHHINCCLYSGDIAPFKIYYKGVVQKDVPLKVSMESGWNATIQPDEEGMTSFEIPRSTYAATEKEKKRSEKMIVEASYDVNESGIHGTEKYHAVHYVMTLPLSFGASPLEYESKVLGFATAIGVMLVFSLGLYYNRRRKRKSPKEIYFDEE
ncbi:MAG: hypothetical protein Q7T77_08725 [Sulfuricurvum sp.]|nr:hypothetical protein [Sulfuricurvum sp.]